VAAKGGVAAAADLLGHSDRDVTLRYIDPTKQPGRDARELLAELAPPESIEPPEPIDPEASGQERSAAVGGEPPGAFSGEKVSGGDRLQEAEDLLRRGYATAAAMTARVALERRLVELARRRRDLTRGPSRAIDAEASAILQDLNRAAHGAELPPGRVAELLAAVGSVLQTPVITTRPPRAVRESIQPPRANPSITR
jgi:hypothetical protein